MMLLSINLSLSISSSGLRASGPRASRVPAGSGASPDMAVAASDARSASSFVARPCALSTYAWKVLFCSASCCMSFWFISYVVAALRSSVSASA